MPLHWQRDEFHESKRMVQVVDGETPADVMVGEVTSADEGSTINNGRIKPILAIENPSHKREVGGRERAKQSRG